MGSGEEESDEAIYFTIFKKLKKCIQKSAKSLNV